MDQGGEEAWDGVGVGSDLGIRSERVEGGLLVDIPHDSDLSAGGAYER